MTDSEKTAFMNFIEKKKLETPCRICPFNLMICREIGCIFENMREIVEQEEVDTPIVDVVPMVHGHWVVKEESGELICSNCGIGINASGEMQIILAKKHEHYCYNCGAKMDEFTDSKE